MAAAAAAPAISQLLSEWLWLSMKRDCGSGTDVMLAGSLCLSACPLIVLCRYHCFHSISQQSALVREKCFSILELCLCHIKASRLSCTFFMSLWMCVCVCVFRLNPHHKPIVIAVKLHAAFLFFFYVCMHKRVWGKMCSCALNILRMIYFRLKESLSKESALFWQQRFKAGWKHSH